MDALANRVDRFSPGAAHVCAFTIEGKLYCWGDNRTGQLGVGDTSPRLVPTRVAENVLGSAVSIAYAGGSHTCALRTDGALYCWGDNSFSQLGVDIGGLATSPALVIGACRACPAARRGTSRRPRPMLRRPVPARGL